MKTKLIKIRKRNIKDGRSFGKAITITKNKNIKLKRV